MIVDTISIKIKHSKDNLPVLYNESNKNICISTLDQLEFYLSQLRPLFSWTVNAYVHNAMQKEIGFRQQNPNISTLRVTQRFRLLRTFWVTPYFRKAVFDNLHATEDFLKHLIKSLPPSSIKGKSIFMKRLRPSIFTSKWLLKRNVASVDVLVSKSKMYQKLWQTWKQRALGARGR